MIPPAIIFFGFFCIDFYLLYKSELKNFKKHEVTIEHIILKKRSNNKFKETTYIDLLIYPRNSEMNFAYTDLSSNQANLLKNLRSGDELTITQENKTVKLYHPNFYYIVQLEKDGRIIISLEEAKNNWKKISIASGSFAIVFFFWYLSRMYRYKKFGSI